MIQRFVELGSGYGDLYELIELAKANSSRLRHIIAFHTAIEGKQVVSLAIILDPAGEGKFQPIYICREGIPNPKVIPNKRYTLFEETAANLSKTICELTVKPSTLFADKELYYQYLIGILRLNHFIPPLHW
ncbi:methylthioribose kinase [Bacillus sp. FJAT-27225]|uniref:DUF7147 family protein n=1 Tax=Bacillus sp. FJAT-27225 TaxID=1743144 RepID=UPI00080C29CF|nr:methylthioribose kinase [Bacillus sp. FJAT-27225]OCA85560.1 methylthioribose kinase [Bacillus sp. FJAT-27225]